MSTNGKLENSPHFDKWVRQFIDLRTCKTKLTKEFDTQIAEYTKEMERISGLLINAMNEGGVKAIRTERGTVTVLTTPYASLFDKDAFMSFVRENDMYELMDRKANSQACREYALTHAGCLPPGVKMTTRNSVSVRSATEKDTEHE